MNKYPLVSVIIPTHNRKKLLSRLLKGIFSSDYRNIEIIVVDDASTDGTYEYIKSQYKNKKIKIFKNKNNLQTAASKNLGVKFAKGEFVLFIDDDNVISRDFVSILVRTMIQDESIGEAGPIMYFYSKPNKLFWSGTRRNMFTSKTTGLKILSQADTWDTDDILNSYMVRGELFKKYKIRFKDKLGIMYEESDLAYKIKKLGYKIKVVKRAKIYHDVPDDRTSFSHTMSDRQRVYFTARNRLIFHADYSTKIQLLAILFLWNWFFVAFYLYTIIFYSGSGRFSLFQRFKLSWVYIQGVIDGFGYVISKKL